jgi:hypothetical protein
METRLRQGDEAWTITRRQIIPVLGGLMRFDGLKVKDPRLLSFNSKLETGNPEPMPYSSLAASGDNARIDGHKVH